MKKLSYILLGILIAIICSLVSCKTVKKNTSVVENTESSRETVDGRREVFEAEGRSAELISTTTSRENEETQVDIHPKGEFVMTPDGQFIGEATAVKVKTTRNTDKKVEEKSIQEDTATSNTITSLQADQQTAQTSTDTQEEVKKKPSFNWVILAVILVFIALVVARWKGWL